jgi:uncharacterized metal-binding protein YceD (DUF177 family)
MKFYLHEITEQDKKLAFTEAEDWVLRTVEETDESAEDLQVTQQMTHPTPHLPKRPIDVSFNLRKVDEVFIVTGQIKTSIKLLCSRCASLYALHCSHCFSSLFCQDPTLAGIDLKQTKQIHGHSRHAHEEEDKSLGALQDVDITHITTDCIDLAEILKEQLHLQIPFQPLCKENCKGICLNCGTDFNLGKCACAQLTQQKAPVQKNPFSVLGDLKQKA